MPDQLTLAEQIDAQIRADGPMSLSTYMRLCLTHPTLGYYRTADPLGRGGDFVTAPEISQTFGEMIGMWIANTWQSMGAPASFDLVELGPGRGTLMQDVMRVLGRVPGFLDAARVLLVETNPVLISEQKRRLAEVNPAWIAEIVECDDRDTPLIVIANEFFDALPIKQFQKENDGWHERLIGLKDGQRAWGLSPTPIPEESLPEVVRGADEHAVWEAGQIGADVMKDLATRIARRGGALLAIDYGYTETRTGETFQAVSNHEFADPLADPGHADLTAHVDFEALSRSAETAGAKAAPVLTQGQFLLSLGIDQRLGKLAEANPGMADELHAAVTRLIDDRQMGKLFKVLCIHAPGLALYPFSEVPGAAR